MDLCDVEVPRYIFTMYRQTHLLLVELKNAKGKQWRPVRHLLTCVFDGYFRFT